jgi:hypothetical protein
MKRGAHLLHVKPRRKLDELERGIDLVPQPLHDGNTPNPAEEATVIFEVGTALAGPDGDGGDDDGGGGCVAVSRESPGCRWLVLLLLGGGSVTFGATQMLLQAALPAFPVQRRPWRQAKKAQSGRPSVSHNKQDHDH